MLRENPWPESKGPFFQGHRVAKRHHNAMAGYLRGNHPGRTGGKRYVNPLNVKSMTQGVKITDIVVGVAALWASTAIPGMIYKAAPTTTGKIISLALSAGVAVGVAMGAKKFLGQSAGQAAIIGGLGGTTLNAVNNFTGFKILGAAQNARPVNAVRQIRETIQNSSTSMDPAVQLINP
jgi:hypothetical protein